MADKVVVTGGAGFIGSHLCDELVARGYRVVVVDDLYSGAEKNIEHLRGAVEFRQGSILDETLLKEVCSGAKYVFHQAAMPSVPRSIMEPVASHEANATGTLKVLVAAREAGVSRVVYAASSSYYGDTPTLPKVETMSPNPLSPYALQKYAGEAYAKQFHTFYGLETVSLRYFNIYGPRQNPDSEYSAVIPKFIKIMKSGQQPTINGDGSGSRGFTYVTDAVAANLLAAETPGVAGEVFNVAGRGRTTLSELVAAINTVLGTSIAPIYGTGRAGDILHSEADIAKAESRLGYNPAVSLLHGLEKTAASIH